MLWYEQESKLNYGVIIEGARGPRLHISTIYIYILVVGGLAQVLSPIFFSGGSTFFGPSEQEKNGQTSNKQEPQCGQDENRLHPSSQILNLCAAALGDKFKNWQSSRHEQSKFTWRDGPRLLDFFL